MVSFLYFHFCNGIDSFKKKIKKLEYPAHILMGFFFLSFLKKEFEAKQKNEIPTNS